MYHVELYVFYRLLLTCTFYNSVLVTVHIHATCINYFCLFKNINNLLYNSYLKKNIVYNIYIFYTSYMYVYFQGV